MAYLGKITIRKWALEELRHFFKPFGFKKITDFDNTYFHKTKDNVIESVWLSVGTGQSVSIGNASICFLKVEKIIYKITRPDLDVQSYQFSRTVSVLLNEAQIKQYGNMAKGVDSQNDVIEVCNNFKTAFLDYYLPAFEYYSDPKNVLELWDSFPKMGDKADNFPSADNYSKVIILSKMCHDENYQKRIDETIDFFQSEIDKGEDWMQVKLDVFLKVVQYLSKNSI